MRLKNRATASSGDSEAYTGQVAVQSLEAVGSLAELGDVSDLCRKSAQATSTACAAMTLALMKGQYCAGDPSPISL
jgi:hypothetical protein